MKFKNLSYLIGHDVEVSRPLKDKQLFSGDFKDPDRVTVVAEYPRSILVEVWYGTEHFTRMVSKAAMFCGDERIKYEHRLLTGKEIWE